MFTYADPEACPGCRHRIDADTTCESCGVDLTGQPAARLRQVLALADRLVAELAEPAGPGTAPVAGSAPTPAPRPAPRPALSAASIPKLLLGLGALCLLVASIVFLVVAWATLGVGGRTGVLAGFTVVASALLAWVARRGLRAGAESFSAIALGLLVIDLGGAREAGWLGSIGDAELLTLVGAVVSVVGAAVAVWGRGTQVVRLAGAEVIALGAVAAAAYGAADAFTGDDVQWGLVATLVCLVAAATARVVELRLLASGSFVAGTLAWSVLAGAAVVRLEPPTFDHVWGDLAVWPTLVAAALAGLAATQRSLPTPVRVAALAVALVVTTLAVTVVGLDESASTLALVELGVIAACTVLAFRLPRPWAWAAAVPSNLAAYALTASALSLAGTAVATLLPHDVWAAGLLEGVDAPATPWTWPLLMPVGVIGVGATIATCLHCASDDWRRALVPVVPAALGAAALVPALYGVPLVAAVLALALAAAALGATAVATGRTGIGVSAAGMTALAVTAGLANEWTTAGVLAVVLAGALALERRPGTRAGLVGLVTAPVAAAGLLRTAGELAGLPTSWQALPVVVVLGLGLVLRPEVERDVSVGAAAAVAVAGSVVPGGVVDQAWLAVYLTVAGVLVTASALVNPSRRALARLGLGFFVAAQWVRLEQLGVDTVEAYTLPLAVVLLAVGAVALRRGEQSSLRALGPGLALALVPTLVLVLADPVGPRAVLLGVACVACVGLGLARNLAAPLVAGAAVGALVVLREGTLAQVLPQWAIIGLVGVVLTVVGITWEQRLLELRRASAYVRGMR